MAILDLASGKSLWRGLDYYKEKRVKDWTRADDGTYDGTVQGSELYHVHMEIAHPKRSTCDCPFAAGRRVIASFIETWIIAFFFLRNEFHLV